MREIIILFEVYPQMFLAANALRVAAQSIGEIIGKTYSEDLLDSPLLRRKIGAVWSGGGLIGVLRILSYQVKEMCFSFVFFHSVGTQVQSCHRRIVL